MRRSRRRVPRTSDVELYAHLILAGRMTELEHDRPLLDRFERQREHERRTAERLVGRTVLVRQAFAGLEHPRSVLVSIDGAGHAGLETLAERVLEMNLIRGTCRLVVDPARGKGYEVQPHTGTRRVPAP